MTANKLLLTTAISIALSACVGEETPPGTDPTPTATPEPAPTLEPSPTQPPNDLPTPTAPPTPTAEPSATPTASPTIAPSAEPTLAPTLAPMPVPSITSTPSLPPTPIPTPSPTESLVLEEAEEGYCGVDEGGNIETEHPGFTGHGYVNTANVYGASIYWKVTAAEAGMVMLSLRFANGDTFPRDGRFVINGLESEFVPLPHNGEKSWDWRTYTLTEPTPIYLMAGENSITLSATTDSGLANIDQLIVAGMAVEAVFCESNPRPTGPMPPVTATPLPTPTGPMPPVTATPTAVATPTSVATPEPTPVPTDNDGPLPTNARLTLDAAKSGQAGYVYWNVNASDDTYAGAFLLPNGNLGSSHLDDFYYNSNPTIAVNGNDKMFMRGRYGSGHYAGVAELTIPDSLSRSSNLSDLPVASPSQNFYWPYKDVWQDNSFTARAHNGLFIGGMCVVNEKLVGTLYGMYVSDTSMAPLWVLDGTDLDGDGIRGMWDSPNIDGSHYAGWISPIPSEYQSALRGTHLFGMSQGNLRSLNFRGSNGPSLFTYDFNAPSSITGASPPANGTPLEMNRFMDFGIYGLSADQNTPGAIWTNISEAYYGFIIPGTRTYAVFGYSGGHKNGVNYGDASWLGVKSYYANDRTDYDNHYWLFDLDDILNASDPGSPRPYEHGSMDTAWHEDGEPYRSPYAGFIRGGSYDPVNKILYLVAHDAEPQSHRNSESSLSIIIAYDLSAIAR